jgi:hypothetical protein
LIAVFTSKVREWVTDASTTLNNLKAFTLNFDVDLHEMDRRFRATFSRAILQWLLEASAEVLIIAFMMTSSSSAYGSSFHDNGDGNDNKKNFFTLGKHKSNRDDDDNDDSTSKGAQAANMAQGPMQRMVWAHVVMAPGAGWVGAAVGTASQSSRTRRRSAAGAKVPQHWMPRSGRRSIPEHARSALHSMPMLGSPLRMPQ